MALLSGIWWYWAIISWCYFVLGGTGQYRAFTPVYIEKVEIWSGVTDLSQTTKYGATT